MIFCARATRGRRLPLAWANGTSRRASGWVRRLRAVEDRSASIPEEITSELGGTFILFDARSREQPWPLPNPLFS